jgi:hypothetical protein
MSNSSLGRSSRRSWGTYWIKSCLPNVVKTPVKDNFKKNWQPPPSPGFRLTEHPGMAGNKQVWGVAAATRPRMAAVMRVSVGSGRYPWGCIFPKKAARLPGTPGAGLN